MSNPSHAIHQGPHPPNDLTGFDYTHVHDIGRVACLITNFGLVGSNPGSSAPYSAQPSMEWPKGSGTEYLWAAGLWIGAEVEGEKVVTTSVYEMEFRPGLSALDRIYVAAEGQPPGKRYPASDADDDGDGRFDEDRLNGRDDDGDARIDEDYAAISNQMFFCEYSDTDPNIRLQHPDHTPIGFKVQQTSLAWSNSLFDDVIAFDYLLINPTDAPVFDVYVAFFADCDIGRRTRAGRSDDDFAGFWEGVQQARVGLLTRNVKLSIGYMFDDDGDAGTAEGYIGIVFLGSRTTTAPTPPSKMANFLMSSAGSFDQGGDPTNDEERYRTLDGTAPRSIPPPNPITGLRPEQLSARSGDYRILVSAGPFAEIDPGESLSVRFGIVVGRGFDGMIDNAVMLQVMHDGAWFDRDADATTGVLGRETPICGPRYTGNSVRLDACDADCDDAPTSDTNCYDTVPASGCAWINLDCATERSGTITGIQGAEHVVNWIYPTTTPVDLQDFQAWAVDEGVRLEWEFAPVAWSRLVNVSVQRATAAGDAFTTVATALPPSAWMSWVDRSILFGASLRYRLVLEDRDGSQEVTRVIEVESIANAELELFPAWDPGPGQPILLRYRVGSPATAFLEIFDAAGRLVRAIDAGTSDPDTQVRAWDRRSQSGRSMARGLYFVRLRAESLSRTRRLVLLYD